MTPKQNIDSYTETLRILLKKQLDEELQIKLREEKRLAAILIKKEFIQKKILLGQNVQYTYDYDGTSIISNKPEIELK